MDRMSGLSDETLSVIMGFNGATEAARVLTLAKRFRNLHTVVGSLGFDDVNDFRGTFSEFVTDIAQWLRDVLKHGVVDVSLDIHRNKGDALPLELFSSNTVEFMDIDLWDDGTEGEMAQIKHFLGKLAHLKLVKVRSCGISDDDKLRITNHLLMLPRASPKCKVEIISFS
ncbi:hypothetical protein Bca52824_090143 [Brassica carinata]|uniref:FBD domain-containing protein n=1 Tax=Brassica carinata TaxID=52824 RepID=A0A8X7NVR9_BRACI|nr:hypothetical protein Bca52824_090143 [Brassica carinata]